MKLNNETILKEDRKTKLIVFVIVAVIFAIVIGGLMKSVTTMFRLLLAWLIKNWIYVLVGIGALLLIRKIFFRRPVQDMRIVR